MDIDDDDYTIVMSKKGGGGLMMFQATFVNISSIKRINAVNIDFVVNSGRNN